MPRIVVIGAGPAGTVASIIFARAGIEVLLVEQHRFPRDKVCGECLSALGIDVLNRLGLHDQVLSLRPAILTRAIIHSCDGHEAGLHLPSPMWGISRLKMDAMLLDAAREAGVQLLQPARCEAISPNVRVRMLATNELRTIETDFVILADGKGTLLPSANGESSRDLGLKAHFQNIIAPADAIELFGVDGHYGGIAPIEDGLWNVAFSVPAARFKEYRSESDIQRSRQMFGKTCPSPPYSGERQGEGLNARHSNSAPHPSPLPRVRGRGKQSVSSCAGMTQSHDPSRNLDALFSAIVEENVSLSRRMNGAQRVGEWLVSPLPRFAVSKHWPQHVIPIGNSAAALEPIGGEGMGLAMRSAELAAEAVLDAIARVRASMLQSFAANIIDSGACDDSSAE